MALAESQYGVLSREQLLRLGVSASSIDRRVARRRLQRVHRGVFVVGHRVLSMEARWLAAVLAGGLEAVLSHRSAAHLSEIRRSAGHIEITVPGRRRAGPGIEVHTSVLAADEVTVLDGLPVTTVSRTLLDLAAVLPRYQLERAVREAEYRRLWDATSLSTLLERHPRRRGTGILRQLLAGGRADDGMTRSELEERFLPLLDGAGLPRPKLNRHVSAGGGLYECDCVWLAQRLVVELDGRDAHTRRAAFESDRARDRALAVAGWRVVRVTSSQLTSGRAALAHDLRELLGAS